MTKLNIGDKSPLFNLTDQDGKNVQLKDYEGQKLLVYFYPKADTPGCTKQACSIMDSMGDLNNFKLNVVGISPDKPDKQKKFSEKYSLKFPLLSDEDHKVAKSFGAWGEKSMYGKKYEGIIRSAFLIDEKGIIKDLWYKVKPDATVPNALKALTDK